MNEQKKKNSILDRFQSKIDVLIEFFFYLIACSFFYTNRHVSIRPSHAANRIPGQYSKIRRSPSQNQILHRSKAIPK